MGPIGAPELIIIVIAIVVLFGATKLPKFARSLGQAQKEFKAGLKEGASDVEDEGDKA